jgi:streptogramin lyase
MNYLTRTLIFLLACLPLAAQSDSFSAVQDAGDPHRVHLQASGRVVYFDGVTPLGTSATADLLPGRHTLRAVEWGTGKSVGAAVTITVPARPFTRWQEARAFSAGITPLMVAAGGADVVLAGDGHLSILRSTSGYGFSAPEVLPGVENPVGLVVADFDGDGHADIAVAGGAGEIVIRRNNGDGSFTALKEIRLGRRISGLAVGDFNGDGITDLAVADPDDNMVTLLLGNGDGTFREGAHIAVGMSPRAVLVADFNGDGIADLATANFTGNDVTVLLGNGHGDFRNAGNFPAGNGPVSLAVMDSDLAVLNRIDGTMTILRGGTFELARTLPHVLAMASGGDRMATAMEDGELRVGETAVHGGPAPAALIFAGSRLVEADSAGAVYILSPVLESEASIGAETAGSVQSAAVQPMDTGFTLGTSSVGVGPTPGSRSVLLSGTGAWTATANASWLHIAVASGANGQTFTFSFDANSGATRAGTITFNSGALTLTVTQSPPGYIPAGVATQLVSTGLTNPSGLAADAAGNLFIADTGNNAIKKWTASTQQLTTLVSTGLSNPSGIAVDASGNVYIADTGNNAIKEWKASTQQVVTLLSAGLSDPDGVAIDGAGNLYIADNNNNAIKELSASTQQVTTLVSSPNMHPAAVAVDSSGNVYYAIDTYSGLVMEWNVSTQQATIVATEYHPTGIAVDGSGNDYVSGGPAGQILVTWGASNFQTEYLAEGQYTTAGVAVDGAGNVYFSDSNNGIWTVKIAYLNPAGITVPPTAGSGALPAVVPPTMPLAATSDSSWLGIGSIANGVVNFSFTANPYPYTQVAHITVLGRNVTVTQAAALTIGTSSITVGPSAGTASVGVAVTTAWSATTSTTWLHLSAGNASGTGNQIVNFTYDANPGATRTGTISFGSAYYYQALTLTVTQMGTGYVAVNPVTNLVSSGLNGPSSVAVDGAGNVSIADALNNAIKSWNPTTQQVSTLVSSGLNRPYGIAADPSGDVYIADSFNGTGMIKEWNMSTQLVGTLIPSGLSTPTAVAVDNLGNLYFNSTAGATGVSEWSAITRQITTLFPQSVLTNGLAVDNQGNVYFESGNTLEVWNPANPGVVTPLSTGLNSPSQVAVDGSGNVYVADSGSNSIKEWNAVTRQLTTLVSAGLSKPAGVAVDSSGNVYIADTGNNAVKMLFAAFVSTAGINEPAVSGSDSMTLVYPTTLAFTAVSDQTWLTILSIAGGVVNFEFATNTTTSARVAHITVLGQSVTVTQAAGGALSLGTTALVVGSAAGASSVLLNASRVWTATANASWLHVSAGSTGGTDSQTIIFTYDTNSGATRTGTITFNTLTLNVTQAASGYVRAGLVTLASSGLTQPTTVAVDSSGNVYLGDNGSVKKWSASTQQVTTLFSGINTPSGLAIDGSGNVYFSDSNNNAIKEWVAATQQLTTLVSSGLNVPTGLAADSSGNIYIVDSYNNAIKEWNRATQQVSTVVSGVTNPSFIAVDAAGNLYFSNYSGVYEWSIATRQSTILVSDYYQGLVAVDGCGNLYYTYGTYSNPTVSEWNAATQQTVTLAYPASIGGLASDASGNIYFVQSAGSTYVLQVIPTAYVNAAVVNEPATAGSDSLPPVAPATTPLTGVYVPSSDQSWLTLGNIANGVVNFSFTANPTGPPRVGHITELGQVIAVTQVGLGLGATSLVVGPSAGTSSTEVLATQSWSATANASWLHLQAGSAAGAGNQSVVFTYDANSDGTRSGTITFTSSSRTATLTVTQLSSSYYATYPSAPITLTSTSGSPSGVAVDASGNVYFTDGALKEWSISTQQVTTLASPTSSANGVALDNSGNVYYTNGDAYEWNPATHVSTLVVTPHVSFYAVAADGSGNLYLADEIYVDKWTASTQQLTQLTYANGTTDGVAVDSSGNVYFSENSSGAIAKWSPSTQQVSTAVSGLSSPYGVAVDLTGNVFFSETGSNSIQKVSAATQQVTTLTSTGLSNPHGIAVDISGSIYIADYGNLAIKELPMMYVNTAGVTEPATAGSDALPPVYPTNLLVSATSDQGWLTIGTISNGVVNFSFSANTTGVQRAAHITVLGQGITVTQLAGTPKLVFSSQPVNIAAGNVLPAILLQLQDSTGNLMTGSSAAVTLTSAPPAINVTVDALNGVATFGGLVIATAGTYTLTATSTGLTPATSNSFIVAPPGSVFVSGQVTASGVGLSGVTINVNGSQTTSTTTNSSGNYTIYLSNNGSYTLAPALTGYAFNAPVTFSNLIVNQTANFSGIAVAGIEFYPVTPCRIADTRTGAGFTGAFGPPSMAANTTRTFPVPSSTCGIPATAAAYSLNFTVAPPGPLGLLTTWPTGQSMPNVSTLNSYTGTVVANAAIVPAGQNGAIDVYVNNATDVLFDINGYFAPPLASGLQFYPVTPCRVADTRAGAGFTGAFGPPSMAAGTQRSFPIPSSSCGIPATAAAYSFNFTVVPPGPLGVLTTWPTGKAMPNASTLNSYTGTVVANAAIVPAGTGGAISIYVNNATDVLFDINGYFAPPAVGGLQFYPVSPCRVADTRTGAGFMGAFGPPSMLTGVARSFPVPASICEIPASAGAYSFNFTVVPPGQLGLLTTWPTGNSMPNVSTLNSYNGTVVANAAIVPAGAGGAISIYVNNPTDVLFDINGYFSQ